MNKDLDERLIPNGEYRDALNVEVSTSEGSDVGAVQNILGNYKLAGDLIPDGYACVGSIANEKTNKLYWFISSYSTDAVVEYDLENNQGNYVVVDAKGGTSKASLKFFGNFITGINIIDNLLFWTDNRGEPKKINIDTCKTGTTDITTSTKLSFKNGSFNGITADLISVNASGAVVTNIGQYVFFEQKQMEALLGESLDEFIDVSTGFVNEIRNFNHYRKGKFLGTKEVIIFQNDDGNHFRYNSNNTATDFELGDVFFNKDLPLDIEESHITVIKPKPLNTFSVKVKHVEQSLNTSKIPNLFETTFPRFSYRYKFLDGEHSAFAPFTQPVFNPKYPKDTSKSIDGSVSYTKDNAYDIKEPYNKAMANSIHSIELSGFITAHTPEDVEEIEILYKKEDSNVIYSIATINHIDKEWHYSSGNEEFVTRVIGGVTGGKYTVTTENIYAALPANQLLRPWDNVPRKALAQEVSGNRIIYGNYLQNYEVPYLPTVNLNYDNRKILNKSFETEGLRSVKSQRNYQLGVVLTDKHGRETPVFTSSKGAANIPWQDSIGNNNASKSNQLVASVGYEFPEWVDTLKFFVKQNSNEYYNLIMQRAWVTKSTYELDNSEGHLWISFPSSDRNKISEEDYIILKKKIEPNASQVTFENKFKVIDIKNEAPDSIKYRLVNYGTAANNNDQIGDASDLFDNPSQSPDFYDNTTQKGTDTLRVDHSDWQDGLNGVLEQQLAGDDGRDGLNTDGIYVSWSRVGDADDNMASKKYKVVGGFIDGDNYVLKLSNHISKTDADIAHCFGDAATNTTVFNATPYVDTSGGLQDPADGLHPDLVFQIERKELIDSEDFSGSFFVKISKNQVSSIIETGSEVNELNKYKVLAKNGHWFFRDDIASGVSGYIYIDTGNPYGLTNYNGSFGADPIAGADDHQDAGSGHDNTTGGSGTMRLSDNSTVWSTVLSSITTHSKYTRFFVDAVHMVAGQSDASDYAKYSCITWSGATIGDINSAEQSSWSYPPLKKWLSDQDDLSNYNSTYYQNDLISESPNHISTGNDDFNGLKVDGWVGALQNVSRDTPSTPASLNNNHINGLEGIVTTVEDHTTGPRRWFSGMNGVDSGVGQDTKTYANDEEEGRHFMHLSFFAPGKDLHNGTFNVGEDDDLDQIYGPSSFAANLQGIWGGGVFTGETPSKLFGSGLNKFKHFPMEGNHDASYDYIAETPAPGVGQGYDMNYRELHERQWDPTFLHDANGAFIGDPQNETRDFIRNLYPGSKFRFKRPKNPNSDVEEKVFNGVYTIKKVQVKKLYNHTSWRKAYNRYVDSEGYDPTTLPHLDYRSVEEVALEYLSTLADDGSNGSDTNLKAKIQDFGAAHNRRLCYIIELDKNPVDIDSPLGDNAATGDIDNQNFNNIEFLDPIQDLLLSDLSKFPAVWELDPKKQQADLDIYYEASNAIPIRINEQTNELFAPIGCRVELINPPSQLLASDVYLEYWDDNIAYFSPGFAAHDGANEIDYTNTSIKFIKQDGSYVIAEAGQQQLIGSSAAQAAVYKTNFLVKREIGGEIKVGLPWYNCFSFGNGLESNRIKDDFNEVFITNGVKASTTIQETYKEEIRKSGLIYSGIYNSNSGINNLNQFIQAEKITKDLNPTYGSIQKLFSRNSDLVAFCEDKVLKILANKDAVFNADGNTQLTANQNVLGQTIPFVGEYGIAKNPESFASESYRAYFTDKQRGAVLRLSKDGLTPISKAGMHDWFRDNLSQYYFLLGTYDAYKEDYNITLGQWPGDVYTENIIFNTSFTLGEEIENFDFQNLDLIEDGSVYGSSGTYQRSTQDATVGFPNNSNFDWANNNETFLSDVTVTNHDTIPTGYFQQSDPGQNAVVEAFATLNVGTGTSFVDPVYSLTPGNDDGWWYDPRFTDAYNLALPIFGPFPSMYQDAQVSSDIQRIIGISSNGSLTITESNIANSSALDGSLVSASSSFSWPAGYDPDVEKTIEWPIALGAPGNLNAALLNGFVSSAVTRDSSTGAIIFDRAFKTSSIVFKNIGDDFVNNNVNIGTNAHATWFNGDELTVSIDLICYPTAFFPNNSQYSANAWDWIIAHGYNIIEPEIYLTGGYGGASAGILPDSVFVQPNGELETNQRQDYYMNVSDQRDFEYLQAYPGDSNNNYGNDFEHVNNNNGWSSDNNSYHAVGNNYKQIKGGLQGSATVSFADTNNGTMNGTFNYVHNGSSGTTPIFDMQPRKVTIGATWKFRDPAQQNDDGSYSGSGDGITQNNIITNLQIHVKNNASPAVQNASLGIMGFGQGTSMPYYLNINTDYGVDSPLSRPLWGIKKLFSKKGFGLTANAQPPVTALYDDPTTVGNDALTFTQLQALSGFVDNNDGTYTVNGDLVQPFVGSIDNIPSYQVDSWVEVSHAGLTDWQVGTNVGTGAGNDVDYDQFLEARTSNWFGNNNSGTDVTVDSYTWREPSGASVVGVQTYPFTKTTLGSNTLSLAPANTLPNSPSNYSPQSIVYNIENGYWHFEHDASSGANHKSLAIHHDISSEAYTTNDWYFVDVEFEYDTSTYNESNMPLQGTDGGNGLVYLPGVLDNTSSASNGELIDANYVGEWGGGSMRHVHLVPVFRKEYSDDRWVLRAIFKPQNNSYIENNSNQDYFTLRFYEFQNQEIKVQKIISKKINELSNSGNPTEWSSSNIYSREHTFSDGEYFDFNSSSYGQTSNMYFSNSALCWDNVPQTSNGVDVSDWLQNFAVAPATTSTSWKLNFKVIDNPYIGGVNFNGELAVRVTNDTHGMLATGINATGDYEIEFNMEADITDWTINPSGATLAYYDVGLNGNADIISFSNSDASNPLTCAVRQIELTDLTRVYTGNSTGSWNLGGFEPSIDTYIQWDNQNMPGDIGRIQFENAPLFDDDFDGINPVMINQLIETPINRYEQYRIQFVYKLEDIQGGLGDGELNMYYFNSLGYGFRITNIGGATSYNGAALSGDELTFDQLSGSYSVNKVVTIEELEQTEVDDINVKALKNTLVIRKENENDPASEVTAWIDNVSMQRVYSINPRFPSTTATFNENVNGWSSFKSFIPESGVSLSKKYFTFKNAALYQHYVPTFDGDISDLINANNYNVFYGLPFNSTIKAVLNEEPSLVKTSHTIGYEGSQANVLPPGSEGVTINNANAIGGEVKGWKSTDITTDMDKGSLHSFIKKENKWFGYIKGKPSAVLDSSKFSVQGIGFRKGDATGLGPNGNFSPPQLGGNSGGSGSIGGGGGNTGGNNNTGGGGGYSP